MFDKFVTIIKVVSASQRKSTGIDKLRVMRRLLSQRRSFLRFCSDLRRYQNMGGIIHALDIRLGEFAEPAGISHGEYFQQDLHVAQLAIRENPREILDVGSRLDGYVAHVATCRKISVLDIRPMSHKVKNVTF